MLKLTEQQIQSARSVDLLTYLQRYESQNLRRDGANTYRLRDHDSITISNGKWYWWTVGFGSNNALDFLVKVRGVPFVTAVEQLSGTVACQQSVAKSKPPEKRKFALPLANHDNHNVIAYLERRGIDRDMIDNCIRTGDLYQDRYKNCVFVGRDRKGCARFACNRGAYGDFKGDVAGSDKRYGFLLSGGSFSDTLTVTESAIDVLSLATLRKRGELRLSDCDILSLSGVSPLALECRLSFSPQVKTIIAALDNDNAGNDGCEQIRRLLRDMFPAVRFERLTPPKPHKDWNDCLR
jgi:hypothetical protein